MLLAEGVYYDQHVLLAKLCYLFFFSVILCPASFCTPRPEYFMFLKAIANNIMLSSYSPIMSLIYRDLIDFYVLKFVSFDLIILEFC